MSYYYYYYFKFFFAYWLLCGGVYSNSRSSQEFKKIYSSSLRMTCIVLISVTFVALWLIGDR
jgi:hypothetical protein